MSQRKRLFLFVFVWTCLCLIVFKMVFLPSSRDITLDVRYDDANGPPSTHQAEFVPTTSASRSGSSLRPPHESQSGSTATSELPSSSTSNQRQLNSPLLLDAPPDSNPISEQNNNDKSTSQNSAAKLHFDNNPFYYDATSTATGPHSQSNVIDSKLATAISEQQQQEQQRQASGNNQVISSTSSTSSSPSSSSSSVSLAAPGDAPHAASNQNHFAIPISGQAVKPNSIQTQIDSSSKPTSHQKHTNEHHQQHHQEQPIAGSQCHYDYPNLYDLQFNNIYWQKLTTRANSSSSSEPLPHSSSAPKSSSDSSTTTTTPTTATYYLYNAYYDDRWRAGLPSVRILAMIDRVHPPPTNCLLWSNKLTTGSGGGGSSVDATGHQSRPVPLVTRAQFVYAWYPKWGNYEDGLLQPWIVTCPVPRAHAGLVPDSVSLVGVPEELNEPDGDATLSSSSSTEQTNIRAKRSNGGDVSSVPSASMAMPPSFSSSSPSSASAAAAGGNQHVTPTTGAGDDTTRPMQTAPEYDCKSLGHITNHLPVYNWRPPPGKAPEKFAVCVKGLDFPYEDISIRLVEWIELLHLLGAKKIFLYNLDVHENISKVLNYYQKRGIVELSQLTLPGDQPNLPEYQHLYLKQKLTTKRQNELIPYNDCLYRNLHSYKYLALLDIDEVIMPLKDGQNNWYDLMDEVEQLALSEQNYSRASYNVRNVYFFDDLSGPLGTTQSVLNTGGGKSSPSSVGDSAGDNTSTPSVVAGGSYNDDNQDDYVSGSRDGRRDSLERGIPHYLHMMSHVYRSKNYTEPGQYVKCFHNTERVVSLHNHFPMNCFGQCTTYSIPVDLAHLQHYRKDCVGPLKQSCKNDFRHFTTRDTTIWKYKQRMIRRTTRVLNQLGLLSPSSSGPGPTATTSTTPETS